MSTSDILELLIEKDNGYLITSKAVESGVSKPSVSKYVREHDMEKVAHGIYILDNVWPDELFVLQQRNKNIIYSGETALYLHGLIDREYSHICFTVPTGYNATHIKKKNKDTVFHVDAIQAFGKYRIYPKKWNIHLLSVSSHKIHGPKGVGFLYINSKAKVQPLILGGGQQNGMRSGTDNVPGIAGLGVAAKMMYQNFDEKVEHLYQLKERMAEGLSKIDDVVINGMPVREGAPHILSVSFLGIRSEVLLHTLEDRNIYVSAGSACSSHKRKPSATLSAMGMSNAQIENTVRISFSEENTFEEVDYCLEVLNEVLPMLKRYARR